MHHLVGPQCPVQTLVLELMCTTAWQVGSEVARRARGLGFSAIIAYDPFASKDKAAAVGVSLVSLDEALSRADFFSLHMPLTDSTRVRSPSPFVR